jgi:hypothetical protein
MSARKIPMSYNNTTGKMSSKKSRYLVGNESSLERKYYLLFEFDETIERIESQPFTLEYEYKGKVHSYTPDVLLKKNGYYIVGEVKYRNDLKKNFEELRPKFEAAIEYCKQQNERMYFRIFTDRSRDVNSVHLQNISFLLNYDQMNPEYFHTIYKVFRRFDTVQELLDKITPDKYAQMHVVPTLWAMIRHHAFKVDLFLPLLLTTVLEDLGSCKYAYKPQEAYCEY